MTNQDSTPETGKYFTAREVNALLPQLETYFQHIDLCRQRVEELSLMRPPKTSTPAAIAQRQRLRSQIEFLLEGIQQDIDAVGSMGGVIKDLDAGLVDFLGWLNGADIWLCWKRGEKSIQFWHSLYEGFGQRQTLPGEQASQSLH